ncbi:MAG: hypothetical protein ACJ72M_02960 [Propionibacteriaceae bacterium]
MATTGGGAAGAVSVRGVPSGGVSAAGAAVGGAVFIDGVGADDVGSVIDFPLLGVVLDALGGCLRRSVEAATQQIYSTPVASAPAQRSGAC